ARQARTLFAQAQRLARQRALVAFGLSAGILAAGPIQPVYSSHPPPVIRLPRSAQRSGKLSWPDAERRGVELSPWPASWRRSASGSGWARSPSHTLGDRGEKRAPSCRVDDRMSLYARAYKNGGP